MQKIRSDITTKNESMNMTGSKSTFEDLIIYHFSGPLSSLYFSDP